MHKFHEHHKDFQGFSEYFRDQILPQLASDEDGRVSSVKKAKIRFGVIFILGAALAVYAFIQTQEIILSCITLAIASVLGWAAAPKALSTLKTETKTHLVSNISHFLGWEFTETVDEPPNILDALFTNKLLTGRYHRAQFEDRIRGSAHGADFEMIEAHLERKDKDSEGRTRWVTLFKGQLIGMDFHRKFLGKTVVLRDKKIFNSKSKGDMKRVGLVDPIFEKIFEAYGTDQVEARYLLTPTFMQRLVDLETQMDGHNIRFGFVDGLLLIVVETENRFEAGSMLKSLIAPERTQKILDDFGAVLDVIDGVLKPDEYRPVI